MKNLKKILLGIFVALFAQQVLAYGHYDTSSDYDDEISVGDEAGGGFQKASSNQNQNGLALHVAVTDNYIVIGARGGFQPNVYYEVLGGRYPDRYVAIQKESEEDPGRVIWAVYSSRNGEPDSAYVDENNNFLALPGEGPSGMQPPEYLIKPRAGTVLATISPNSARVLSQWEAQRAVVAPLSVFDVIAKDLVAIHAQFSDIEDIDCAWLIIDNSFDGNRFRELRPLMSALKNAGFRNICLSFLGGENEQEKRKIAYEELYSPLGLKPSNKCASIKLLTVQSKTASAADLMKNQKFSKDIDRVLKYVAGLQTSGKTDGGSNEGNGGIGDGLAGLFCGDSCSNKGGIATKAKGNIKTPTARDIDMGGSGSRSESDIMKVVRQRTPGLRHLYNKFLKNKPGFQGKITLKFSIAPDGSVSSISIVSSTTGYGEFDASIKNAVSNWTFNKVDFGSTTVKIPFTFSEN